MSINTSSLLRVAGCALILAGFWVSAAGAAERGCLDCHADEQSTQSLLHRAHGQTTDPRLPEGDALCQSCHGASMAHRSEPRSASPDWVFGGDNKLSATERVEVCSGCHSGDHQKNWPVSEHAAADVACDDCHNVHAPTDAVQQRLTQGPVCMGCHVEQKAAAMKFSRHPIREGIVACSDCHQPHGGKGPAMLVEATINETCYQCHTEKRGPFLWEHEPVQDDCTNCHTPHGSVNDNMLMVRMPFLCQQCHIDSGHRGINFGVSDVAQDQFAFSKGCLNCHGEIHGTNHVGGGAYFE